MQLTMPEKKHAGTRWPAYLACAVLLLAALGAYMWYDAGRLRFEAEPGRASLAVPSLRSGRIAAVEARPGLLVRRGDVLARFDDSALRAQVEQDRRSLATLALALPPEHLRLPAGDGGSETLSGREERRRAVEEDAEKAVHEAADIEAQAAVTYNRASMLFAQGKITREQFNAADAALNAARRAAAEARRRFEGVSLSRAESSADIRRLKQAQLNSGAAALPVETRVAAYERAREQLARSEAALASSFITAPEDGMVTDVFIRPGDGVDSLTAVALLRPSAGADEFEGRVPAGKAAALKIGLPCLVEIATENTPRKGLIRSFAPVIQGEAEAIAEYLVRVSLLPSPGGVPAGFAQGSAQVTVFLRETPLSTEQAGEHPSPSAPMNREGDFSERAPSAPAGRAAPPLSPLSVETPFGGDNDPHAAVYSGPVGTGQRNSTAPQGAGGPVAVKAGATPLPAPSEPPMTSVTPQAQSQERAEPILPPMKAPRTLRGSALPQTGNNPSIVRPSDLDGMDARP